MKTGVVITLIACGACLVSLPSILGYNTTQQSNFQSGGTPTIVITGKGPNKAVAYTCMGIGAVIIMAAVGVALSGADSRTPKSPTLKDHRPKVEGSSVRGDLQHSSGSASIPIQSHQANKDDEPRLTSKAN